MQGKQNGLSSSSNYSISSPEIGEVKWFGKTNIKHYAVMLYKIHLKVWRGKKKKKVMLIFENIQNIVSFWKNSAPNEVFKAYESKYLYSENVKNFCFTSLETAINSFSLKSLANFLPFCYSTYHKIVVITVMF